MEYDEWLNWSTAEFTRDFEKRKNPIRQTTLRGIYKLFNFIFWISSQYSKNRN